MSQFTFRGNEDINVDYDTSKAVCSISFVQKQVGKAFEWELYESEGTEVIPKNMKAVAVEFTQVSDTTNFTYKDIEFFYSLSILKIMAR